MARSRKLPASSSHRRGTVPPGGLHGDRCRGRQVRSAGISVSAESSARLFFRKPRGGDRKHKQKKIIFLIGLCILSTEFIVCKEISCGSREMDELKYCLDKTCLHG